MTTWGRIAFTAATSSSHFTNWRNCALKIAINGSRWCVSPPIRQALAADTFERGNRALRIARTDQLPQAVNLAFDLAMVLAEVELSDVALQMLGARCGTFR